MRPPAIAFDLDGTLVDSIPDLHAAAAATLAAEGRPPLAPETIRGFVGNGLPKLDERVMAASGLPAAEHARIHAAFSARNAAAPAALTRPYPGVPEALARLRGDGCRLGLCTNKPEAMTRSILAAFGLEFDAVVCGDSLPVRKPDPLPLLETIRALGGPPALYVGDSEVDAETAERAGLPFLFFRGGYCHLPHARLTFAAAFDAFADLPGLVLERAA
jgi:phosphoglycolate phosphatase